MSSHDPNRKSIRDISRVLFTPDFWSPPLCKPIPFPHFPSSSSIICQLCIDFSCLPQEGQESPKPTLCGLEDHKSLPTCKVRREVLICVQNGSEPTSCLLLFQGSSFGSEAAKTLVLQFLQQWVPPGTWQKGALWEERLQDYSSTWWNFELSFEAQTDVISLSYDPAPNRYYFIYDNGDRQGLLNAYHAEACFSLAVLFSFMDSSS